MSDIELIQDHFTTVKGLLARQKLVENLVHRQEMPRHGLIESLVHRQNLVELEKLLEKLAPSVIARILEALPSEERKIVWQIIRDVRKDEVLPEISDAVRMKLASGSRSKSPSMMIRVFDLHEGHLRQIPIYRREDLAESHPVWVDLVAPEEEQLAWAREIFDVHLPNPKELTYLETSARFYVEENGEVHLHSNFLLDREDESRNVAVAFVLKSSTLFSVRSAELPVFRTQRLQASDQSGHVTEAKDVLLNLFAADVEYSANALEDIYVRLESVGKQVFRSHMTSEEAARILTAISEEEDLNGRIRRNVLDTRNALTFLMRGKFLSDTQHEDVREILRDIESLDGHTSFLFNKINFQMDATVGFLNVNHNNNLKLLTVISVVFMPINVIAGIGGMSEYTMMTHGMPWPIAYSALILVMIIIGIMTFWGLRVLEGRRVRSHRAENHRLTL
jgi:magnesium transporter